MTCECPYPDDRFEDWFKCDHTKPCMRQVTKFALWALGWKMCNECCGLYWNRDLAKQWAEHNKIQTHCDQWAVELSSQLIP